jgi:hypothetical protein
MLAFYSKVGAQLKVTKNGQSISLQPVPEIIDPVFAKTSQNARFLISKNERFGLVFVKTGSINSGTGVTSKSGKSKKCVEFSSDSRLFTFGISQAVSRYEYREQQYAQT